MTSRYKYLLLVSLFTGKLAGQEMLSMDEAIRTALQKNYVVMIAKDRTEIAKAQNNIGNAGMSPTVSLNASYNLSSFNSYQEFNTGATQDRIGARSSGLAASVNASWLVFDGLRMFAVKRRLAENVTLTELQARQEMENTVYNVIVAYNNAVRIKQLIKASQQNLAIYEERKKMAELRFNIGSDSRVEMLLASTDVNRAKSDIVQLELQLLSAKSTLNALMSRNADNDFTTVDSIVINFNPELSDLKRSALASNKSVLISKQSELILAQNIKEAQSASLPWVQLNAGYNFTRNQSQAGLVALNRQTGPVASVVAGWTIFNGGKNNRLVKERNILLMDQKYFSEDISLRVDALVFINYKTFILNKQVIALEQANLAGSKELLDISLERYKVGKTNFLETIETQRKLEEAQVRYINALYNTKISEAELLRVNGSLVK